MQNTANVSTELLEKLRKVKALADDAETDAETEAAMLAFQRLLSKYGLTAADVSLSDLQSQPERIEACIIDGKQMPQWITQLQSVIAVHFRCFALVGRRIKDHVLWFVGMPEDAAIAAQAFLSAKTVAEIKAHEYLLHTARTNAYTNVRTSINSYYLGFVEGLHIAFKHQEADTTLSIIVTMPEAVRKENEKYKRLKTHQPSIDYGSSRAGIRDGENHGYGNRLGH